jgi:hypothetical protein
MSPRLEPILGGTLEAVPDVCHDCVWWQTHGDRSPGKQRWLEQVEEDWGPWGTVYHDDDGRLLGSVQYGPAVFFPKGRELPAGPPSEDAILITCVYLAEPSSPWVVQSLLLAAVGEASFKGAQAVEAFGYRYPDEEPFETRAILHCTIFPHDLLADLGFFPVREAGRVQLARLELRGLDPGAEADEAGLLAALKRFLWPAPVPAPRAPRP